MATKKIGKKKGKKTAARKKKMDRADKAVYKSMREMNMMTMF